MILGIGCDIVEISRIEKAIARDFFLRRYFTDREIELIESRGVNRAHVAAANFCAKEAVVKALGAGFGDIAPKDIEVLRGPDGAPYILLHGAALMEYERIKATRLSVSLSHSKGMALAFVVIE